VNASPVSSDADEDRFNALRNFAKWLPERQEAFVAWLERASPRAGTFELAFAVHHDLNLKDASPWVNIETLLENILEMAKAQGSLARDEILGIAIKLCEIPDQDKARFSGLLARAMDRQRVIALSVKAGTILWRQGRVFAGADSITQIRPVFEGEAPPQAAGGAIVHELRIDYFENGARESVTLLLDAYRLDLLRQAIERAEAKEASIRASGAPTKML
jgi:hypothetical protein